MRYVTLLFSSSAGLYLTMFILVILILAIVHTGEFVTGREAVPHSRPYMVIVEMHMPHGRTKYCGGFLVSADFVMTAAQCQASSYTVLLGIHNVSQMNKKRVSVQQSFIHKDYDPITFKNDIMLLKLSSKIFFSEKVRPIALAGQNDGSLPKSCFITGWGKTKKNAKHLSPILMETSITLIDNEMCRNENSYCSDGETGPNEGDSGGPLVCEDEKAYGVISSKFYPHSGGPQISVYAKIPDYTSQSSSVMKTVLQSSNACII